MNNMKKPQIRFKGFTNDWEQRKLSNIADIVGGGTPSTSNPDYWDGNIDWYTPAEIGEQIFAYGSVRKITKEGLIHSSAKILPAHKTVLFTSRAGIGNMAILKRPAATNQGFQSLVCHDDIDPYFMFSMGDSIKAKAERVAAGSTFAEISGKKLGELEFMFPDTDEQKAIGAYFKNLDYLITLHQRKYEKLQIIKKSMLENCFPKNGEKVPKIRFSGFTGDWEQRKLGDIADRVTEKNASLEVSETFTNSAEFGIISQRDFFDHDITNKENIGNYFIVRPEDFVYNPRISVTAPVGPINRNKLGRNGVMSPLYTVFRPHDVSNTYLEYFFKTNRWHAFMQFNGDSGARSDRFSIGTDLFYEMPIPAPSFNEQEKIGSFFANLSDLITLHQSELEKLQKIKKSLLERMFV